MVVARDRKHHADVKCEKHRFPRTLPMIFDRLSRHLGFSNLARLISRVSNLGLLYLWLHRQPGIFCQDPSIIVHGRKVWLQIDT